MMTKRGLTLIELFVVIVIMALLFGISLAAVQTVRERARGLSCQNNIRQIGVAIASFEASHGYLPTGITGFREDGMRQSYSIPVALFPFVDQQNTFDALTFNANDDIELLKEAIKPLFLCPIDNQERSRISYLYSQGTAWLLGSDNGVFSFRGTRPQSADIQDGLSNTISISEFADGTSSNFIRSLDEFTDERVTVARFDQLLEEASVTTTVVNVQLGSFWRSIGLGSSHYTHYLPPGKNSGRLSPHKRGAYTPSSNHGQLIHSGRADGSVASIAYSIDRVLWVQMGDIADGGKNHFEQ